VGWILFLCAVMVLGALNEGNPRALALVFVWLPFLVPVLLGGRSFVRAEGDQLVFRGCLRTRSWRRNEITAFRVSQSPWSPLMSRIEMSTTSEPRVVFWPTNVSWPKGTTQLDRWLLQLERWRKAEQ